MKIIKGGITSPKGFMANGEHIGLKKNKKDLAIIYSAKPAIYAGTFTTNVVKAACVQWNMERYKHNDLIQAITVNSGNANACTGLIGIENNETIAKVTGDAFNIKKENVLIGATGVIGEQLKVDKVVEGVKRLSKKVSSDLADGHEAATAIMTTDTFHKEIAVEFEIGDKTVTIGGMAKGSGMIHPNMATMLSFISTDANISKELLDEAVKADIADTYNMISVDGDTSTNDMVMVLANGMSETPIIDKRDENYETFKKALNTVNKYLAMQIVHDGEGVTKVIEANVVGAKTNQDAKLMAKSVITSNLVKTAFFGEDANWGRVLCAMGYSGAQFDPNGVSVTYESNFGSIKLLENGLPVEFDEEKALGILKEKDIKVNIQLEEGSGVATAWGCDLSYEYVKINGEYRS
jgi:glutamate N-acetyltransferase/amino-acid N-acetyltransferase